MIVKNSFLAIRDLTSTDYWTLKSIGTFVNQGQENALNIFLSRDARLLVLQFSKFLDTF